eukprot:scaffold378259_cov41-Prasinocladus_malaysianus.AAC.1
MLAWHGWGRDFFAWDAWPVVFPATGCQHSAHQTETNEIRLAICMYPLTKRRYFSGFVCGNWAPPLRQCIVQSNASLRTVRSGDLSTAARHDWCISCHHDIVGACDKGLH